MRASATTFAVVALGVLGCAALPLAAGAIGGASLAALLGAGGGMLLLVGAMGAALLLTVRARRRHARASRGGAG